MFGLSFLYPLFLAALAAVAIPLVLHLFRRRTEVVVDFPAVRLLHKAPVEQQRRRRLRELVLLALRMVALALLALAFARPYFASAALSAPGPVAVVALDTSLSVSAPGQFERAREAAREAVRQAPATYAVSLVTFADAATVVVPPTTDRGSVLAAIDQARPTAGGTRYRTALARAAEAIPSGRGSVTVVTDLQQAGWETADEGAVPEGIEVVVAEVAAPAANVAVTGARRDGSAVVVALHNFGMSAARVPVRLQVDGREIAAQTVAVGAQAAAETRLSGNLPARGGAEVRIDDPSGYQEDNARYLLLDPPPAVPVFVITADPPATSNAGLYVERALSVAGDGTAFALRVVDGRAFSALADDAFADAGAVILLGTTTLDRPARARIAGFLAGGGRVLLALGPDIDRATLTDTLGVELKVDDPVQSGGRMVTLVAVDGRHPIFRPFLGPGGALGDVYVERYHHLPTTAAGATLASFAGAGEALVELPAGQGRLLVFASDLDNRWNRFPLSPSFVPWAIETARYLTQGRERHQTYTLPEVPPGVAAEPGLHVLGERTVAVNPDIRESNPARVSTAEFAAAIQRSGEVAAVQAQAAAREQEERQRLWQLGLLVMLAALAGEGFVGRKAV